LTIVRIAEFKLMVTVQKHLATFKTYVPPVPVT
jgi:hypothetical protein